MKVTPVVAVMLLVSCTRNIDVPSTSKSYTAEAKRFSPDEKKPETCHFGMVRFNKEKRAPSIISKMNQERKGPGRVKPAQTPEATIYLDFDGQVISNSIWKTDGEIGAAPANLRPEEIDKIIERVSEDFSPFNVVITTDEEVYKATNPFKRMRVVITETWEWFGVVGGTAFVNSFSWGNDTPCFIFSTLLFYNEKYIAEAISHEVGHTLGLQHQSLYDGSCMLISEYNLGFGEGEMGWAPIMGIGYYRNVTTWHKGPSVLGCDVIQDDVAVISDVLGVKPDESLQIEKSNEISATTHGLINNSHDVDYYFVEVKKLPITISAIPMSLPNREGANLALKINVYDKKGKLEQTSYANGSLSASTTLLDKGKYFIGVETVASSNQSRYGMLGRYSLSMN